VKLNIPNILTLGRICAIPILIVTFHYEGNKFVWLSLAIYFLASVSDYLDGYIARKMNMQSNFGRLLDPIADKLIVSTVIILLVKNDIISGWHIIAAIVILCREILVSGLREFLAKTTESKEDLLPVTYLSKIKTAIQMLALGFLIGAPAAATTILPYCQPIGIVMLWIASVITMYTGYQYLDKGLRIIED